MLTARSNDSLDFNRPWVEYKQGFGDVRGDHWLGENTADMYIWSWCHVIQMPYYYTQSSTKMATSLFEKLSSIIFYNLRQKLRKYQRMVSSIGPLLRKSNKGTKPSVREGAFSLMACHPFQMLHGNHSQFCQGQVWYQSESNTIIGEKFDRLRCHCKCSSVRMSFREWSGRAG